MTNPSAGWYANPTNALEQRYWAGEAWTEEVRPLPPTVTPDMPPPTTIPVLPPPEAATMVGGGGSEW